MDGQYAWPSSGEVIYAKRREILTLLKDDRHNTVSSEKMVEVFLKQGQVVRAGDQFGLGRLHSNKGKLLPQYFETKPIEFWGNF